MSERNRKVPFGPIGIIMAVGIVYGDIGTSPLYVMKTILNGIPPGDLSNPQYILGALSCVIWTLTLQTTVKYVLITLRADNNGEGGILALYALIRRRFRQAYVLAAIGAAALLADGVITPAMTVTSAMEGLNAIAPYIPVVPVTILIIVCLFLLQPFGTASLGRYFGVFMLFWFVMMTTVGFYQLMNDWTVIRAFNPLYAIRFLIETPQALVILGAIFLCTTGAEALYSDLGHCGLKNIRVSWIFVKTALIINYLGQAAWIINNPAQVNININPFFAMMPGWFLYAGVFMATAAAIIASQALISGSYTVISEAISLNLWPNVKIKYPTRIKGQMYIPSVNYALLILCVIVILMLQTSVHMEAAYGLAITISMMMTSMLLFLYFIYNKKPWWYSIPLTFFFVTIETGFLIANVQKFAHGGFVPVIISSLLFFIMYSWYNGRRIKNKHTTYDPVDENYIRQILKVSADTTIPKTATHLVYIVKSKRSDQFESKITYSLFRRMPKRADTYWFMHVKRSDEPYKFAYEVTTYAPQKIFRIDIEVGFKVGVHADKYFNLIANELQIKGEVDLSTRYPSMLNYDEKRGDFQFMVVDRMFRNMSLKPVQKVLLNCYSIVKRCATSDTQMYDLDPSQAVVETIPLLEIDHSEEQLRELLEKSRKEKK